jgi:hypothetical protein
MRLTPTLLVAVAFAGALPASAILIRADRDDAEYLELATRYPASILLTPTGGEGVLIAPRWVLTSGEVARLVREMNVARLRIRGEEHGIQSIFVHPAGKPPTVNDIGLIHLKTASRQEPVPLYRRDDEKGMGVAIVGHGGVMKIGEAARPGAPVSDRRARAGINTVDRVTANTLEVDVKPGDEASDLQAATTPLEQGAAAYIEANDAIFVAGISHRMRDANRDGILGNAGDVDVFMRVSAFVPWIEATLLDVAKKEIDSLLDPDRR